MNITMLTFKRVISMTSGVLMMLCAGTLYNFGIYAPVVKDILKYTQFQIGSLGVAGTFGNYLGILVGLFFDKFGGKATALVSGCLLFGGYSLLSGAVSLLYPSHWIMLCVFMFMIGQGNHGSYTASMMTNVQNYHVSHRGKVVGFLATCYGVSGALFSQLYWHVFGGNDGVEYFLIFTAITLLVVNLLGVAGLNVVKPFNIKMIDVEDITLEMDEIDDHNTGIFEILEEKETIEENEIKREEKEEGKEEKEKEEEETTHINCIEEFEEEKYDINEKDNEQKEKEEEEEEELTCKANAIKIWSSPSFLWMFVLFFVGGGTGLMFFNQVGSQIKSIHGTDADKITTVTILTLGNAVGRLGNGLFSDLCAKWVPKVFWLVGCLLTLSMAFVVLSFVSTPWIISLCAFFIGYPYGGLQSLLPAMISLLFPLSHFGQNWGWLVLAPAFGSLTYNTIASLLYDRYAITNQNDEVHCFGIECFMIALLIAAMCNFIMALASGAFLFFTKQGRELCKY